MITMQKAFFEGIASPLLNGLWSGKNHRNPYASLIYRRVAVKMILLGAIISCVNQSILPNLATQMVCYAIGLATVAYGYFVMYTPADLRFLWDCCKLNKEIPHAKVVSLEGVTEQFLRTEAEDRLVDLAGTVVYCDGKPLLKKIAARNTKHFKKVHRLFLRFGLVEQSWSKYFALAKETLKTEEVRAEA